MPAAAYALLVVAPLPAFPSPKDHAYVAMVEPGAVEPAPFTVQVSWLHEAVNDAMGAGATVTCCDVEAEVPSVLVTVSVTVYVPAVP
jgi:hypothetical protein